MWLQDIKGFCTQFSLAKDMALNLKCTAEHLVARTEGGPDTDDNIVAACHFCNQARHRTEPVLSPDQFCVHVRQELQAGRWHGLRLRNQI